MEKPGTVDNHKYSENSETQGSQCPEIRHNFESEFNLESLHELIPRINSLETQKVVILAFLADESQDTISEGYVDFLKSWAKENLIQIRIISGKFTIKFIIICTIIFIMIL